MEERNLGFVMTEEDLSKTTRLSDHDFRAWIVSCVHYMSRGELPDDEEVSPIVSALFDFTIPRMNTNIENYEKRAATNKENGKKGGRPRKQAPSEIETQHNPENPMGYSETQHNPENPMGYSETQHNPENHNPNPNPKPKPKPKPKPISIPTSSLSLEEQTEEIEGCGGKEEPNAPQKQTDSYGSVRLHTVPYGTIDWAEEMVDCYNGVYKRCVDGLWKRMTEEEVNGYMNFKRNAAFALAEGVK